MFQMRFDTENDSFQGEQRNSEVARIIREIAQRIENGEATGLFQNCKDENGNVIGTFKLNYKE